MQMKKSILAALSAVLLIIAAGCSRSNKADTLELLGHVPAEASAVAVVNLERIVDRAGGKVKDGRLTDAGRIPEMMRRLGMKQVDVDGFEGVFSPESGVECTSAVFFTTPMGGFFGLLLSDPAAVRAAIDRRVQGEWQQDGKIYRKGTVCISDNLLMVGARMTPELMSQWTGLSKVESAAGQEYAEKLAEASACVTAWASVGGLLDMAGLSFTQRAGVKMALGMCFNNPTQLWAEVDAEKDVMNCRVQVLDNKLQPSKCELKVSDIDTSLVESLGGEANTVAAIGVSRKLVEQIRKAAESFGGRMPGAFAQVLDGLDGTVALGASDDISTLTRSLEGGYRLMVQTSGDNNAPLLQTLQQFGKVDISGKDFVMQTEGYGHGALSVKDVAGEFKGAWFGVAMAMPDEGPKSMTATLRPAAGSLELGIAVKF